MSRAPSGSVTGNVGGNVVGSVASVTAAVTISTSTILAAPRALDTIADSSITVNDALWGAVVAAAGQESVVGTTFTVKTPHTATTLRTFTLDSGSAPTVALMTIVTGGLLGPLLITGGFASGAPPLTLYLPYEYTSVPIETANTNPFDIDPEQTTIITKGLTPAD